MLTINPSFLKEFDKIFTGKVIVVAGTNGKTTTSKMIRTILQESSKKVIHNESGANLLNGIASSIVLHSDILGASKSAFAVFEVDENTLPLLLGEITPDVLVILNLFRDQLDRYGEINTIARKWQQAVANLPKETELLLNADDPNIAYLGNLTNASVSYFGIDDKSLFVQVRPHAMDATFCPQCAARLTFDGIYLGHLGVWRCEECKLRRPRIVFEVRQSVIPGVYNVYNAEAAILVARKLHIDSQAVDKALKNFSPAFGRQEEFIMESKKIKIFLSKNPTGFNESLRTVKELGAKHLLVVLNDRIPDGRDVSWIWDVDFEELVGTETKVIISGDRCYDMGLRIKYGISSKFQIGENLKKAIALSLEQLSRSETLYILPTYSAMLEVRKILGGRKIL